MEENKKLLESLLEKTVEYGKTSFELAKLKALDKTSDVVSSFIPHAVVFVLISSFMIFLNLGIAFWLGRILGEIYFGFFVVAAFYVITGIIFHFFFHKRIKRYINNAIIRKILN
jgi:hypothetical protein